MDGHQKERLLQALNLVHAAMTSPNTFENSKESTFSALRRGCLDLRKDTEQLDSEEFSSDLIRDAWLFLMELSKAKLRRKHALECINIMLLSPKWGSVLRNDTEIQSRLSTLSPDMQAALGYKSTKPVSPKLKPSTASIAPATLVRKTSSIISPTPTVVSRSKSASKQQIKRSQSKQDPTSSNSSRRGSQEVSAQTLPAKPVDTTPQIPQPPLNNTGTIMEPGRRPEFTIPDDAENIDNPLNPFRCDYNPFKEFRGKHSIKQRGAHVQSNPIWWNDSTKKTSSPLPDPWW